MAFTIHEEEIMKEKKTAKTKYTKARRKDWKKAAKHTLKTHYVVLVMIALLGGLLGVEGGYNYNKDDIVSAQGITVTNENKATATAKGAAKTLTKSEAAAESSYEKVIEAILNGNFRAGKKLSEKEITTYKEETRNTGTIVGRTSGVLAGLVNDAASGLLLVKLASGVKSIVKNGKLAGALVILLVLGIYIVVWFFFINPFKVLMNRMYLEARTYKKVPIRHILFLSMTKKWRTASKAMFRCWLYLLLWDLTIIGGIIKHYSYWCVPYIIAENPSITGKEAIELSCKMMKGRKWETFKYDLTFVGWGILGLITMGTLNALFVNPYWRCTDANLYSYIREECKKENMVGTDKINDKYLYEAAPNDLLQDKYGDILYRERLAKKAEVKLKGVKRFCVENLGLWLGNAESQKQYEEVEIEQTYIENSKDCAHGLVYPSRLSPLWNPAMEKQMTSKNNYLKSYSIWSLICMFAIFAFVGWGWEVALHLIKDGVFINRGAMHGPWLPIYGAGAVMILMLLKRFRKKPAVLAITAVILCGCVEYFTSYFMEMSKGIRWWDYTGYFLNINGRICAEGLTVFAVGGMAAVYILAPALDRHIQKISPKILVPLCIAYALCFTGDAIYSHSHPNIGKGITDYDNYKNVETSALELQYYEADNSDQSGPYARD